MGNPAQEGRRGTPQGDGDRWPGVVATQQRDSQLQESLLQKESDGVLNASTPSWQEILDG